MNYRYSIPDLNSARKSHLNLSPPSNFSMSPEQIRENMLKGDLSAISPKNEDIENSIRYFIPECI